MNYFCSINILQCSEWKFQQEEVQFKNVDDALNQLKKIKK